MDTNTEITTAARRIARELRTGTPDMVCYFDADGQYVTGHQATLSYESDRAERQATSGAVVKARAGSGFTQREAQDLLDAAAAHPGDHIAQAEYLMDLSIERQGEL